MQIDECQVMLDVATVFFATITIVGWCHVPNDALAEVSLENVPGLTGSLSLVGQPSPGVASLGSNLGFRFQAIDARGMAYLTGARLKLTMRSGRRFVTSVEQLVCERILANRPHDTWENFKRDMAAMPGARVLSLGGRDRSRTGRGSLMPGIDLTIQDICPGEDVDVVGDAHHLSTLFAPHTFDGILCVSVFEHLAMPWRVALEMNRVLKPGGVALVRSHQTLGMHDVPYDLWRYSNTAWHALFNAATGFEILKTELHDPNFIVQHIPLVTAPHYETSAGFETSQVLIRKTGETNLAWPVDPQLVVPGHYDVPD